jgi:hypothetical protein
MEMPYSALTLHASTLAYDPHPMTDAVFCHMPLYIFMYLPALTSVDVHSLSEPRVLVDQYVLCLLPENTGFKTVLSSDELIPLLAN